MVEERATPRFGLRGPKTSVGSLRRQQMPSPRPLTYLPGHSWRDKWTTLRGPLSLWVADPGVAGLIITQRTYTFKGERNRKDVHGHLTVVGLSLADHVRARMPTPDTQTLKPESSTLNPQPWSLSWQILLGQECPHLACHLDLNWKTYMCVWKSSGSCWQILLGQEWFCWAKNTSLHRDRSTFLLSSCS